MTLDPTAALHTLALFLGSLGGRCNIRVVLSAEDASVLLITPGSAPLVEGRRRCSASTRARSAGTRTSTRWSTSRPAAGTACR
jgi:hypothetical protein